MAGSTFVLKDLSENDEIKLLEIMKKDLANSIHALCFARKVIQMKKDVPRIKGGILSPNGDCSDSTVFIYFIAGKMFLGTYYSATADGCERLKKALATTELVNDANYVLITAVHDRVHQAVGTDWCHLKLDHVTPCNLFSISPDKALAFDYKCPEDVTVRRLLPEDAELVNSVWPHRMDGTVDVVRQAITLAPSSGLYRKSDNELLSWVLQWFYGGLGLLQTVKEAKRRGYAQIVVAELCKQLARENWPIHATVLVGNFESMPLFEKMGFSKDFLCHYVEYVRTPTSTNV